ncbi:MAG: hypothetical protein QM687_17425 [Ferruginibacter sp.]
MHVGAPPSPVSYYQQVGRAGRAIEHASVVLLPSAADAPVWDYFATATLPVPEQVRAVLKVLSGEPVSVVAVEAESGVRRGRVELILKQLAVEGVTERTEQGWVKTGLPWHYDAPHYESVLATRRREADIMRAYVRGERCLMELLQESLDDPSAEPCGRCSVCRGSLPADLSAAASPETIRRVTQPCCAARHTCWSRARCGRVGSLVVAGSRPSGWQPRAARWSSPTHRSGARRSRRCSRPTHPRRPRCWMPSCSC